MSARPEYLTEEGIARTMTAHGFTRAMAETYLSLKCGWAERHAEDETRKAAAKQAAAQRQRQTQAAQLAALPGELDARPIPNSVAWLDGRGERANVRLDVLRTLLAESLQSRESA